MTSYEVVRAVVIVLVPLIIITAVLTFLRAFVLAYRGRTDRARLAAARALLVTAATSHNTDLASIAGWPFRIQVRALIDIARAVTGTELENLRLAAERLGVTRRAEALCASRLWWRRLYGARIHTVLGTDSERVARFVYDANPLVRAQAAQWMAARPTNDRIGLLLVLIYDDVAFCRFCAKDALLRIRAPAIAPVADRLTGVDGVRALPLLEIAAGLPNKRFLRAAIRLAGDADARVRRAAADVLGAIGGDVVAEQLMRMVSDDNAEVRAAAAAALGRMEHLPAAPRLSEMLADEAWPVRRTAAEALRNMGAPGEMLLRRTARAFDTPAGKAATQSLDLSRIASRA